ncbi:SRPBCC domain-containing protein [Microbacteriaceae bacterium VKM Ac-2854]|nr:SRPBCC domain-containing protein [Microbacteriaceae bacterium VKM Ac-2854]
MQPSGTLERVSDDAVDLILVRRFDAPIEDVWASITDPARTALWFGPWRGERPEIEVQMVFEEGQPWFGATVSACEAPRLLRLTGGMDLELRLEGNTTLTFVHRLGSAADAESYGPGWEYYLDQLVASRTGAPLPAFADYDPAQRAYYRGLAERPTGR